VAGSAPRNSFTLCAQALLKVGLGGSAFREETIASQDWPWTISYNSIHRIHLSHTLQETETVLHPRYPRILTPGLI
jgi:hypothetical protein